MIALSLLFGLTAAACEVAFWATQSLLLHHFIFAGVDQYWMSPASYAALFAVAGAIAAGLVRLAPGFRPWALFLLAWAAAFAVAFLFHPRIHMIAALALAAGVAWQSARRVGSHYARYVSIARRMVAIALVIVAAMALLIRKDAFGSLRNSGRTVAATAEAPDVVLLILDTVRAASLSLYGYERRTSPSLEELARSSVTFDAAIASSSWTLPSHASIFTGRPALELRADWEHPLERGPATLAERFGAAGYRTAGFVGNTAYLSRETGVDRGFQHYEDYVPQWSDLVAANSLGRFVSNNPRVRALLGKHDVLGRRRGPALNEAALRWMDRDTSRPVFLFINYYDAHEPYLPRAPFDTLFASTRGRAVDEIRQINVRLAERAGKTRMSPEQRALEQLAYDQGIAENDAAVGSLLRALEQRGRTRRTIIAVTADHGEQFGEHGLYSHGNSLYLPTLHVPLVLRPAGGVPAAVRRRDVVSLEDLGATLLALAHAGGGASFPGTPLMDASGRAIDTMRARPAISSIRPARNQDPAYPSFRGRMYSAVTDGLHLIENASGRAELFDWRADANETRDLAHDSVGVNAGPLRAALLDARQREVRKEPATMSARPAPTPASGH